MQARAQRAEPRWRALPLPLTSAVAVRELLERLAAPPDHAACRAPVQAPRQAPRRRRPARQDPGSEQVGRLPNQALQALQCLNSPNICPPAWSRPLTGRRLNLEPGHLVRVSHACT